MKKCKNLITFLLLFLVFSPLKILGNQLSVSSLSLDEYISNLDSKMLHLLENHKVPGAAIAIVHNGKIVLTKGYGLKDVKNNLPVKQETVFQIASISKSLTAWGVMKLVEQGKIDLDAPVDNYLSRWDLPESEYNKADVTIRRLLSHTAGLSLHGYPGIHPNNQLPSLEESLSGKTGGVGKVYIKYRPGSRFSYSGGGYTLLQLVIEEVSGKKFEDYMEEEIILPLEMKNSSFVCNESILNKTAIGYTVNGKELPNYLFTAKAAAGLYTTVSDMAKWICATIEGYREDEESRAVLDSQTLNLMFTPVKDKYGFGYVIDNLPNGEKFINHSGGNAGWKAFHGSLLDRGNGIVILTNSDRGLKLIESIINEWFDWQGLGYKKQLSNGFLTHLINIYNEIRKVFD